MTTTIEEKFTEIQDHPLVMLMLKYYAKKTSRPIPPVWQDFIKKSTEDTSLDLMYLQLPQWGIQAKDISEDLRGPELLAQLLKIKFKPMLAKIQREMTTRKYGIIPALEAVFRAQKIIPHCNPSSNLCSKFNLLANLDYTYVERGTLHYEVTRTVPAQVFIPPNFIRAYCGPDHSNNRLWEYFMRGLETRFKSPQESVSASSSLEWVMNSLYVPAEYRIDTNTGTRSFRNETFPHNINITCSGGESPALMRLYKPTPAKTTGHESSFRLPTDGRNRPLDAYITFPVLNARDNQSRIADDIPMESSHIAFSGRLGRYLEDPTDPSNQTLRDGLIQTLRLAYTRITEAETFQTERKAALETAAGL